MLHHPAGPYSFTMIAAVGLPILIVLLAFKEYNRDGAWTW